MDETLTLEFDGGSRGNPGPAGIGVVVRAADGTALVTLGRFIGRATNNVAEYRAVITAVEQAKQLGAKRIAIRGDSELIIKQLKGEYRVKHPDMKALYDEATALIRTFESVTIGHNLRHKNETADKLANLAMDRRAEVTDVDDAPPRPKALPTPRGVASWAAGDRFTCGRCGGAIDVVRPPEPPASQAPQPFTCACGQPMSRKPRPDG